MKRTKKLALILTLSLLFSLLTGCSAQSGQEPSKAADAVTDADTAVTVTDMYGREITLTEPVTRIVALSAADCEILYALGAGEMIVGRGEYCDYPTEVLDIPSVESGAETNLEQIIALNPQILFMSDMAQSPEQVDALDKAGIKVVVSNADTIEDTYASIRMIGHLIGKDSEAETIVADMKTTFETLAASIPEGEGKSIYFEVSPLQYGLWAAGSGSYMHEIATLLGLTNIFEDVKDWGEVSEEQVIERNPDYIVTVSMYFGEGPTPEEEILGRAGWENITAVKNGAVLNLANNELSRPVPRLAEGAQLLFDFTYGSEN